VILHRWGGLGNQRYPIGFSGDVDASWASLAFQPFVTSAAANVNFGYWSHDIGGFYDDIHDPELYVRWIQLGALSPIFRAHGFRNTDIEKKFWAFPPACFAPMRQALQPRLPLLPHIYSAAPAAATDAQLSPVHGLYPE